MSNFKSVLWRKLKRVFFFAFISSFVYLLICKWVMPPITITQAGALISGDGLKRDYVSWNQISSHVKLAALAAEDQLFAEHDGFDWTSLRKSLDGNNKHGIGSAASTISQQTAKNVFLWQGDGLTKYIRKIPEFYFTKMIEWIWGKERILEIYLNCIEMGKGIYGIEAAAQTYFKKPANDLSKMEAAQIIACLPNPKIYTVKPKSKFVSWKSSWIQRQMTNLQSDDAIKSLIESEPEK